LEPFLLGARLLLAAVFALSGLAKLADWGGSRRALVAFGVPVSFSSLLAALLPLAELAIAGLLLPADSARLGALGALILLLAFTTGIAANLFRGRTPECRCFGRLSSAPIGPGTLIRNLVFGAATGWVLWGGAGMSISGWWRDQAPSQLVWLADRRRLPLPFSGD
jgi:hypothetical protein